MDTGPAGCDVVTRGGAGDGSTGAEGSSDLWRRMENGAQRSKDVFSKYLTLVLSSVGGSSFLGDSLALLVRSSTLARVFLVLADNSSILFIILLVLLLSSG